MKVMLFIVLIMTLIILGCDSRQPSKEEIFSYESEKHIIDSLINYYSQLQVEGIWSIDSAYSDTVLFSLQAKKFLLSKTNMTRYDSILIDGMAQMRGIHVTSEFFNSYDSLSNYPIVIINQIGYYGKYEQIIVCHSGRYDLDQFEIILNPKAKSGGYYYKADDIMPANTVGRMGSHHFFNEEGTKFLSNNKIVSAICVFSLLGSDRIDTVAVSILE